MVDSHVIFGEDEVPAKVSFDVTWTGFGPQNRYKPGSRDPTDPTYFRGQFRGAVATGTFSGSNSEGFSFSSDPGATSAGVFAEIGTESNGSFLK